MKKKIIIIEGDRTFVAALKTKLTMRGYSVISAEDAESGLVLIKKEKPDLVLLDTVLPKKNGFSVLEDMKKENLNIPVIVISGSGQPAEADQVLNMGATDVLIKADFSPAEFLEKVEKIIGPGSLSDTQQLGPVTQVSDLETNGGSSFLSQQDTVSSNKDKTVLVVEDDEFLRQLVAQKLVQEGFKVVAAIDANETFNVLKDKKPQIILLDLILPGVGGYEILGRLKNDPETKNIPVMVLSNLGQREDIDKAMSAGAEDYMIKANFTPGEIVDRVKMILQKYA